MNTPHPGEIASPGLLRTVVIVVIYTVVFFGVLPASLWELGGLIDQRLSSAPLGNPLWPALGALLAGSGLIIMFWAMFMLRWDGGGWPISHLPPKRLVRRGPYAWMRHPIYVGYTLAFAGAGMLASSPGRALGATVVLTVGWILYALLFEEPRLARRIGPLSSEYRKATPLIPRIPGPSPSGPLRTARGASEGDRSQLSLDS